MTSINQSQSNSDSSPLQKFVNAKKSMTSLFEDMNLYLKDVAGFVREISTKINKITGDSNCSSSNVSDDNEIDNIPVSSKNVDKITISSNKTEFDWNRKNFEKYINQVSSIINKCTRDRMKVAFFGRTSNGKSTVINTILGDRILPSGIGHTTSCFLQMQGSDTTDPYILTENSHEKKPVSSLKQLASALKDERLECNSSVSVYWPITRCPILANDVVFIDSPGIDVSPDLDTWIKQYCIDADLFVLVTNAESTLNIAEKNFFHQVNKLVSKPNVFILNNRWDASASEPEDMEAVRSQHLQRGIDFLVKELECVSMNEAHKRIFFTSAREVLNRRIADNSGTFFDVDKQMFGFVDRYNEFLQFEDTFKKTLSNSAITTKFEGSCSRGLKIVHNIITYFDEMIKYLDNLNEQFNYQIQQIKAIHNSKIKLNQTISHLQNEVDLSIKTVFRSIYLALCEEVNVINGLVDKFNKQFIDDPEIIISFKNDLIEFIEKGLESNVFNRCSENVNSIVNSTHTAICNFVKNFIELDRRINNIKNLTVKGESPKLVSNLSESQNATDLIKKINVDWNFRMDLKLLCREFEGDINFRFSLSPSTIFLWVRSLFDKRISQSIQDTVRSGNFISLNSNATPASKNNTRDSDIESINNTVSYYSETNPQMIQAIGLMTTTTSAMLLIVIGLAWKVMGQRFIASLSGVYASIYTFERITWNNNAKRKAYKKQFSSYISKKFGYAIKVASYNCSKNIEKEFESRMEDAIQIVNKSVTSTKYKTENIESQLQIIKAYQKQSYELRHKCSIIKNRIQSFAIENGFNI